MNFVDIQPRGILVCMLVSLIFTYTLLYVPFVFMSGSFNPWKWAEGYRVAFGAFYILFTLFIMGMSSSDEVISSDPE